MGLATTSIVRFLIVAALVGTAATAQVCAVRSHFRILNTVNNVPPSELRIDSSWQTAAPLVTAGTNSNSNPQGCYSAGNATCVADYGYLRVTGAGTAANCSVGGVHLRFDEWLGGEPKSRFRDRLTVVAPGLSPGAPVQLRCAVQMSGFANVTGAQSQNDFRARLLVNGTYVAQLHNVTGVATAVVNTTVGAVVPIEGHLLATLAETTVMAAAPATGSYAIDLLASFDIAPLTAGVTLQSCSGAAYNLLSASAQSVGLGCGATPPTLSATVPTLGSTCVMTMDGAPAHALTFRGTALGSAVATPLGACILQLDPASVVLDTAGVASATGNLVATLVVPGVPSLAGFRMTTQMLPLQLGGPFLDVAELSNGVVLQLGL